MQSILSNTTFRSIQIQDICIPHLLSWRNLVVTQLAKLAKVAVTFRFEKHVMSCCFMMISTIWDTCNNVTHFDFTFSDSHDVPGDTSINVRCVDNTKWQRLTPETDSAPIRYKTWWQKNSLSTSLSSRKKTKYVYHDGRPLYDTRGHTRVFITVGYSASDAFECRHLLIDTAEWLWCDNALVKPCVHMIERCKCVSTLEINFTNVICVGHGLRTVVLWRCMCASARKRNLTNVIVVEHSVHALMLCRCMRVYRVEINCTNVTFVEHNSHIVMLWRCTYVIRVWSNLANVTHFAHIHVNNRTNATCVEKGFHVTVFWRYTIVSTQARNPTNVTHVVYSSHVVIVYGDIFALIQARNHINVTHVENGFHINVVWRHTTISMQARNHINVTCVEHDLRPVLLWEITYVSIRERNPTNVTPVVHGSHVVIT